LVGWKLLPERPVEVERRTDEREVSKGLRKIPEGFTMMTGFFGKKSKVIGVPEHLFKDETGFIQVLPISLPCACHRFHKPEGTEIECALFSVESVMRFG
jgi:hypothetical protein